MAGGKETPRQKMIGMMYLVLLALLAMNVSKEVLTAFVVINGAMEKTNQAFSAQNDRTMNEFQKQYQMDNEKVGPYLQKAQNVTAAAQSTIDYIENLKKAIIARTEMGGKDNEKAIKRYIDRQKAQDIPEEEYWDLGLVQAKDSYDGATRIMIGSDAANPKDGPMSAIELREKIQDFITTATNEIPARSRESFDAGITFDDVQVSRSGETQSWEAGNFYHVPVAAVITNLTRLQADIKKAQTDALTLLMANISAQDFKFDEITARVIPNSNYVVVGDSFKAEVIVAAYSTTDTPEMVVGKGVDTTDGKNEVLEAMDQTDRITVKDGIANYGYKVASEGEVEWGGVIKLRKPGGGPNDFITYPFSHSFIAAKPSTVVSPTKMNVVYRGLPNPIDVSVAGFSASKIKATTTNGTLNQVGPGQYELKPGQAAVCKVSVSVETEGGTKQMGEPFEFRVKNIPKPEPFFAGQTGSGTLPSGALRQQTDVKAILQDFDFEGVKYNVVEFTINVNKGGRITNLTSNSNKLTGQQKSLLSNLGRGDQMQVRNIWAVGPDGQRKNLAPIVLDVR